LNPQCESRRSESARGPVQGRTHKRLLESKSAHPDAI